MSFTLVELANSLEEGGRVTLNQILERTQGRGVLLVQLVICLPFITPIPLPGVSTLFGAALIWLSLSGLGNPSGALPKFIGERPIAASLLQKVLRASGRMVRLLEKMIRPRHGEWMESGISRRWHSLIFTSLGAILMLPFPPLVPFTNALPAYGVIFIAASLMERDGVMIWIGYFFGLLGTVYCLGIYAGALVFAGDFWQVVLEWFGKWNR